MRTSIFFICLFFCLRGISQTDEHVLLNLSLDSVFSSIGDKDPGGSFFIQQNNQIIYSRSAGLANLKTKEKFSESTVLNVGSITKTCIAYSIFILQAQKKLSIEDSIASYFPEIKNKAIGKIRIKHLLSHTSGLPDIVTANIDNVDFLNEIDRSSFDPGSNFKYSEISYKILALIIQKVSDMPWQEFIKSNIFAPAGMITTKLSSEPVNETLSYKKIKKKYKNYNLKKKPTDKQLDNVYSSLIELRKYVYAINECVFLSCDSLKSTTKPWMPNNWRFSLPSPHGYVWYMSESKSKNKMMHYEGITGGYHTYMAIYPKQNIIVILVNNNDVSYSEAVIKRLTNLGYTK